MPLKLYIPLQPKDTLGHKTLQGLYIYKFTDKKLYYIKWVQYHKYPICFEIDKLCNCYYNSICIEYNDLSIFNDNKIYFINTKGYIYETLACINNLSFILNITNVCKTCCKCDEYIDTSSNTSICIQKGDIICEDLSQHPLLNFLFIVQSVIVYGDGDVDYQVVTINPNVRLDDTGMIICINVCVDGNPLNISNSPCKILQINKLYYKDGENIYNVNVDNSVPLVANIPLCQ